MGDYKKINNSSSSNEPIDEYEVVALAKRLNITIDDMKQMSFVSLLNILLSTVEEKETKPTQKDIDKMFGQELYMEILKMIIQIILVLITLATIKLIKNNELKYRVESYIYSIIIYVVLIILLFQKEGIT